MLKNIMTPLVNLKSIFLHQLWVCCTPLRQFASCVLVDTDDTLPSIFSSDSPLTVMLHKE